MSHTLHTARVIASMLTLLHSATVFAERTEVIVYATPDGSLATRQAVARQLQELIGTQLEPESFVHLVLTPECRSVATFEVPEGPRNARLLNPALRPAWRAMLPLLTGDVAPAGNQVGLARLGAKARELRRTDWPLRIIIIGSLVYDDPRHPAWKFVPLIPSDDCLQAPHCPLSAGVVDFPGEYCQVSWLAPADELALEPALIQSLIRFYRLFFKQHNAELVRVGDDPAAAFRFDRSMFPDEVLAQSDGVGMRNPLIKTVTQENPPEQPVMEVPQLPTAAPQTNASKGESAQLAHGASKPRVAETTLAPKIGDDALSMPAPAEQNAAGGDSVSATAPLIDCEGGNVVFVVDRSGSTIANKEGDDLSWKNDLMLADFGVRLRSLNCAKFAVIGFYSLENGAGEEFPEFYYYRRWFFSPCWAEANERETACQTVGEWACQGGTPTLEALQKIGELEGVTAVILYTDGPPASAKCEPVLAEARSLAKRGIQLHVVGTPSMSKDATSLYSTEAREFLRKLATEGNGHYFEL